MKIGKEHKELIDPINFARHLLSEFSLLWSSQTENARRSDADTNPYGNNKYKGAK
jgi:hypothetical protein